MSDGLISFYVAQQNVREHSFSVDVVIDAQYTKTSADRILPQIPVLETLISENIIAIKNRLNPVFKRFFVCKIRMKLNKIKCVLMHNTHTIPKVP